MASTYSSSASSLELFDLTPNRAPLIYALLVIQLFVGIIIIILIIVIICNHDDDRHIGLDGMMFYMIIDDIRMEDDLLLFSEQECDGGNSQEMAAVKWFYDFCYIF